MFNFFKKKTKLAQVVADVEALGPADLDRFFAHFSSFGQTSTQLSFLFNQRENNLSQAMASRCENSIDVQRIHNFYEVIGAGKLLISKSSEWHCDEFTGFSFGVSWGRHGYAGGVIERKTAIELAYHILKSVPQEEAAAI